MVVVFPAPFGPRSPSICPDPTLSETLSTASTVSYCFLRFATVSIGASGREPVDHAGKRNRLSHVFEFAYPRDGAFDAKAETCMRYGAVPTEVEIPFECGLRKVVLADPPDKKVKVVFALAPADNFAVPFRGENVHGQSEIGVLRIALHVKRLDLRRIAV